MNDDSRQAWSEVIVDHSQFPRRHGELEAATHTGKGENPFCGDRIQLQLLVSGEGLIEDARFQATGCAISTASGSMLTSHVVGKKVSEAEALFQAVHELLAGDHENGGRGLGELEALQMVKQYPARVKCATLAWHVLHHALVGDREVATTE
jgi:nitrogen fixation NifU-like protein